MNSPGAFEVLIVEDQTRYRDLLVREIIDMGFSAEGAASAEEAWPLLQTDRFDLVLLDLNLPGMPGLELFERIRGRDVAVVILTAYGEMDSAVQALRLGAEDYLTKPCSLGDIEKVICRVYQSWLEENRQEVGETPEGQPADASTGGDEPDGLTLRELERDHILKMLEANEGDKPATARQLGISLRTLYYKLDSYRHK